MIPTPFGPGPYTRPPFPAGAVSRGLPVVAQMSPFRRRECPAEADQLLGLGFLRPVVADVLVSFDAPDSPAVRAEAAAVLIPAHRREEEPLWVVGYASAAWLHTGLTAGREPPVELEILVPPGWRRPDRPGLRGRQLQLAPEHVTYVGPVAVTTPLRTAADVARDLPADLAVPILNRLGELTGVRPHQVLHLLTSLRHVRGVVGARKVIRTWADA